jgi:hypothetical protein
MRGDRLVNDRMGEEEREVCFDLEGRSNGDGLIDSDLRE